MSILLAFLVILLVLPFASFIAKLYISSPVLAILLMVAVCGSLAWVAIRLIYIFIKSRLIAKETAENALRSYNADWKKVPDFLDIVNCGRSVTIYNPALIGFGDISYLNSNNQIAKSSVSLPCFVALIDGVLKICPAKGLVYKNGCGNLRSFILTMDEILYYQTEGQVHKYVTTSGGGTDYTGYAIGSLLGSDRDAIILSRQEIKSTVHTDDARRVRLYYVKDGAGGVIEFAYADYDALFALIPNKDFRTINMKR